MTALWACAAAPLGATESVIRLTTSDEALQQTLETASLVRKAGEDDEATPGDFVAAARGDYRQLVSVLYGAGYYGGTVSVKVDGREAADLPPFEEPRAINRIEITVDPGPQFKFSEAVVTPIPPATELPEGYREGEIARSGLIGQAANTGQRAWRDEGHAKVTLVGEEIRANHPNSTLSSRITLDPGPKLRFGPLNVSGNERVRTERIVAIAGLPEGEVYSPEELNDAADRLRRAGAFRSVVISDAEVPNPDGTLPINVEVSEEKRRRLGAGAELSSTEGFNFNAYWLHRNLLGGAERLRFDLAIENVGASDPNNGVDYKLAANLRRPAVPNPDTDIYGEFLIQHEDEPGYLADTVELGFGFIHTFNDDLQATLGLQLRASQVEDAFGERDYAMAVFLASIAWDKRDNELDATRGFYLFADARPWAGLAGYEPGGRLFVDGRAYLGFGGEDRDRFVVAGRTQIGAVFGPPIENAPPDYLFFAGGGGSIRGQPYESIGTGEIDDVVIGGTSYLALSGELRSRFDSGLGVVAFYDAAYVGDEAFYDGSEDWASGAGLGVRYDTGFGPLRVDLAVPVQGGPDDKDDYQIYIGIGQAF